jgi:hypothetical protein
MSIYQPHHAHCHQPACTTRSWSPYSHPPTTRRITLYTVTEPRKPGAEAYRSRIQRTVFTTPFFSKNHKVLYFALFLSGLCTVLYNDGYFVGSRYILCLFVFNHFLFYRIRLHSLVSCSQSWVGLDSHIASKGICFIAPFILVVWLSSPSHVIAFLGVLFDTTPIPRSCRYCRL